MSDDSGIRHNYFDTGRASPADAMLRLAKDQGWVPPGCLLGGYMVHGLHNSVDNHGKPIDPCSGCEGPREKCGGRARTDVKPAVSLTLEPQQKALYPTGMIERPTNTTPEVRRAQRLGIIFGLRRIVTDAEATRAERIANRQNEGNEDS